MTLLYWAQTDRETLNSALPDALVVLPLGATEQHGPHLPTGTDAIVATAVSEQAAAQAHGNCARPLVLAPSVVFGASEHHCEFGGTLSLTPETMLAMVIDLARSVATAGGRRLVLVNGHGGNIGVCHSAAVAASTRFDLSVAALEYWRLLGDIEGPPVPGHAGQFETALLLALRAELVGDPTERSQPPPIGPADVHAMNLWRRADGFTDQPSLADAESGAAWLRRIVDALADRLTELTESM